MRFGPYEVDPAARREGGQAFVYFSVDPVTGDRVAVKVARPTAWSLRRMEREIETQLAIEHPNVLPILDYDEDQHRWYTTQRAEGSLEDLGPFPEGQWPRLWVGLKAVTSAIVHAHSLGYVHRDLSPGNVLTFKHGWAVSDWGFVYVEPKKGRPRMTQPLEHFGTPGFSAPEMLVDPKNVGAAADAFSIGRLAAWGTGLKREELLASDTAVHRWWRRLIDGTTRYEPEERWTLRDIAAHLRATPSVVPGTRQVAIPTPPVTEGVVADLAAYRRMSDRCPHCGSALGRDSTERCLGCRVSLAY